MKVIVRSGFEVIEADDGAKALEALRDDMPHLVLLDVGSFGLTGRQAESALLDSGIVTNRNSVPADPNGAWYTSGVRIGTPALATRGFGDAEFTEVADVIVEVAASDHPVLRYQTSEIGQRLIGRKLKDMNGQRVTDLTSGWV